MNVQNENFSKRPDGFSFIKMLFIIDKPDFN